MNRTGVVFTRLLASLSPVPREFRRFAAQGSLHVG